MTALTEFSSVQSFISKITVFQFRSKMIRHRTSFKALNISIKESKYFCFQFIFFPVKKKYISGLGHTVKSVGVRGAKLQGEDVGLLLLVMSSCICSEPRTIGFNSH